MAMILLNDPSPAARLFGGWQETMVWSCLQGVMGRIYADDPVRPAAAAAVLADFCFFAGRPAEELARRGPCADGERRFRILTPQNEEWAALLEGCWGSRVRRVTRYAFRKDPSTFDRAALERAAAALPEGFALRPMDEELYHWCRRQGWCADWAANYPAWREYQAHGLGVTAIPEEAKRPVAGASSYTSYRGGIEIQIDTLPAYRRRGLARACGAALILQCLDRGLYPSWDAQNPASAALAESLGYRPDRSYPAYEWRNEEPPAV